MKRLKIRLSSSIKGLRPIDGGFTEHAQHFSIHGANSCIPFNAFSANGCTGGHGLYAGSRIDRLSSTPMQHNGQCPLFILQYVCQLPFCCVDSSTFCVNMSVSVILKL